MILIEVAAGSSAADFLDVPREIYKNDPNWVCPLDVDILAIFDPQKNSFHQHGSVLRWVLRSDNGQLIGRIAAFINDLKIHEQGSPLGGVGFFECIDDYSAAKLLFDTAKEWLQKQGMQGMLGPINFGENDTYWGLLVEGFTAACYGMNYNPPYYKNLFDQYGFNTSYEQISNHLDLKIPFPDRFTKIAAWVLKKPGYRFEYFQAKNFDRFASDFMEIYNDAWKNFENFSPITKQTVIDSFNKIRPIMDEKLIWFAYINNEPASFIVILPDANQIIKPLKGKFGLIEKIKFAYYRWRGVSRIRGVVLGTKPKFQKQGLESALFIKLREYGATKRYQELELSWVGDFNEKMIAIQEATGAIFWKKHLTMKKIF